MSDVLEIFENAVEKAKRVRYDELMIIKLCMIAAGFFCGAAFASVFKKKVVVCAMVAVALFTVICLLNKYYGDSISSKCRKCYNSAKSSSLFTR